MIANNIIERAEKYRILGRFDKKSGINFINDALHEVVKRQSIEITEQYTGDLADPVVLTANIIELKTIETDLDEKKYRFRLMNNGSLALYKFNEENGEWEKVVADDNVGEKTVTFEIIGFNPVSDLSVDITTIPKEYETAMVFYVRSRMLEEYDELEKSQYFYQQFLRELRSKSTSKRNIVSKPSEYSLL
jgi:predicted transcriptional regulator